MELTNAIDTLIRGIDAAGTPPSIEALGLEPAMGKLCDLLLDTGVAREALLNLHKVLLAADGQLPLPEHPNAVIDLARLLTAGGELSRYLARDPSRLRFLGVQPSATAPGRTELEQELSLRLATVESRDLPAVQHQIVAFRNDHYIRLAAQEFAAEPLEQVCGQLSDLADVCLDAALRCALAAEERRFGPPLLADHDRLCELAVLAMGKYGSRELNFCSDIDIVFIYESDDGAAGKRSLHEFFSRVCREVTRMLSEPTTEGFAFRVDLRLRPEGSRGPVCNSLAGAEHYYETWGGPYDRLAWLKARPAAGHKPLGQELLNTLTPFVYPRAVSYDVVEEIRGLTARIRRELGDRQQRGDFNVKLDAGGIRDVEFFAQVLQLLHGGKQPALREPATLRALDRLLFAGLVTEEERVQLADAYELWRRIEHRLQLAEGRQTHELPGGHEARSRIAEHMGYGIDDFEAELLHRRERVAHIYQTLEQPDPDLPWLQQLLARDVTAESIEGWLEEAGFRRPAQAAELMVQLKEKPWGPFGGVSTQSVRALAKPLLQALCSSPDPDSALLHFVNLSMRFGRYPGLWEVLKQSPALQQLMCSLFGSSDLLADLLLQQPSLIDALFFAGQLTAERDAKEVFEELQERLGGNDDPETVLAEIEHFHGEELLRIGLSDVAGKLRDRAVWRQLSQLAEVVIQALLDLQLSQARQRYGQPRHPDGSLASIAIIGLGKLGAFEMSYGSDLDLIFVFSGHGTTDSSQHPIGNGEFFTRVAQRLIRALTPGGSRHRLYSVDTRLRPSGSQGTLVVSRSAFLQYHQESAHPWERQVLLRARAVAGDPGLGAALERWIGDFLYGEESGHHTVVLVEMDRLRRRMERELAAENCDYYNFKLGRGGLLDIEFIAQYLQLRYGAAHNTLRQRATRHVLHAARELELMKRDTLADLLQSHHFLRRLEGRLRIVRGTATDRLPRSALSLEVEARRMGYRQRGAERAGDQLLADYEAHTQRTRAIYDACFGAKLDRGA